MARYLFLLVTLIFLVTSFVAQGQRRGYIRVDESNTMGYLNYGAENQNVDSIGFAKKTGMSFEYYTPDELKEYSLNGKIFLSKKLNGKQQFLEQLTSGRVDLYFTKIAGRKKYYLETNNTLQELTKKNYKDSLSSLFSYNEDLSELVNLVRYKRNSLTRIITYSNDRTYRYTYTYFPYRRIGLTIGNSSQFLKFRYRGFTPEVKNYFGLVVGGFIETPIEVFSKWSARLELLFISHSFSLDEENSYVSRNYEISLNSINVPLLVRHRWYRPKLSPYFEMGMALGFNSTADIILTETTYETGAPVYNEFQLDIIDKKELGLVAGAGLDYQLNLKNTIGFEVRYQFNFGMEGRIDHTIHDWQLLVSYGF